MLLRALRCPWSLAPGPWPLLEHASSNYPVPEWHKHTRTGNAGSNGTTLTVDVPALATSGPVRVLGATTQQLQIVPTIRGVGGSVSSGNIVELEGSGFVKAGLGITVDGQPVTGAITVRTLFDAAGSSTPDTQQLLTFTVPAGVSAGVINITTAGGGKLSSAAAPTTRTSSRRSRRSTRT